MAVLRCRQRLEGEKGGERGEDLLNTEDARIIADVDLAIGVQHRDGGRNHECPPGEFCDRGEQASVGEDLGASS